MSENGGNVPVVNTNVGFTKDQAEAILRIKNGRDNYEKLGVHYSATKCVFQVQHIGGSVGISSHCPVFFFLPRERKQIAQSHFGNFVVFKQ